MTPLRQRMINDMTVRGLANSTMASYLRSVTRLARHYRRSPDQISAPEVQAYLLFLHQHHGLCWTTCNTIRHGVRFFYRITLGLPDPHFYVPGAKVPSTLPQVLNHDELVRLFTVTTNIKHRAVLMTAYAAGLRASELGRLQVCDTDSARMCLRVDQGKGSKDRYVSLSPRLLEHLREYWRRDRPRHWLFPTRPTDRPMSRQTPARIYQAAKDKARIRKAGGIHTLRHYSWIRLIRDLATEAGGERARRSIDSGIITGCSGRRVPRRRADIGLGAAVRVSSSPLPALSVSGRHADRHMWSRRLVSEPQRDHRAVDATVKELHCARMSKRMDSHALVLQGGTPSPCGGQMLGQEVLKTVVADRAGAMLPSTQQTAFALGAALTGIIANALGFERMTQPEEFRTAAFWLFGGFVPPALIGSLIAWRFSDLIAGGRRPPPLGQ